MFRFLLVPPITAICYLVTSVIEAEGKDKTKEFKKWTNLWTRKGETLDADEHVFMSKMAFFFPIIGVMLLIVGVLVLLGFLGITFSDQFINALVFNPVLIFGYMYLIDMLHFDSDSYKKARLLLNSFVEIGLLFVTYGFFLFLEFFKVI